MRDAQARIEQRLPSVEKTGRRNAYTRAQGPTPLTAIANRGVCDCVMYAKRVARTGLPAATEHPASEIRRTVEEIQRDCTLNVYSR